MQNTSGQRGCLCSTKQQTLSFQQEGRKGLTPEVVLCPPHEHPSICFTEPTHKHTPYTKVCKTFLKMILKDSEIYVY